MAVINKNGGKVSLPVELIRNNAIPLDSTQVWYSYDDMKKYASSHPCAYVGQILSLVDEASGSAQLYQIQNTAGELTFYNIYEIDKKLKALEEKINNLPLDIEQRILKAQKLKRIKVNSIKNIDIIAKDAEQYIYMVPTGLSQDDNKFEEYIIIDGELERVGTWEVNLDNYIRKDEK